MFGGLKDDKGRSAAAAVIPSRIWLPLTATTLITISLPMVTLSPGGSRPALCVANGESRGGSVARAATPTGAQLERRFAVALQIGHSDICIHARAG
jgi:hypothetical protein